MRLFYRPRTGRPMRVAWTLEEIGVPYEPVRVPAEDSDTAEHRKRHPMGRVPALELDDGTTVFESAAIILHLADLYPAARLVPAVGTADRAHTLSWAVAAMTELERPVSDFVLHRRSDPGWAASGANRFADRAASFELALRGREHLVGDRLSVADIVCGGVLALADWGGLLGAEQPNLGAYLRRLRARPQFARAAEATESLFAPDRG